MTKRKKNTRERRALIGALCTAAVIVAGSTFAWFTSQDEVTNRLTASADYGVAIAEDFTPEDEWVPGQTVNKDVSIVNTGNVDAFVRTWLEAEMRLIKETTGDSALAYSSGSTLPSTYTTDTSAALSKVRLVKVGSTDNYVKALNTTPALNTGVTNPTAGLTEVQAMQAGGWLAYAPADCEWTYSIAADETNPSDVTGATTVTAGDGTSDATNTYVAAGTYGCEINSETFKPKTTGLYLFRRNMDISTIDADKNVYYSGYYYVAKSGGDTGGQGTYYALQTQYSTLNDNPDGTLSDTVYALWTDASNKIFTPADSAGITNTSFNPDKLVAADIAKVTLYTATYSTASNSDIVWTYTGAVAAANASTTYSIADSTANTGTLTVNGNTLTYEEDGGTYTATAPASTGTVLFADNSSNTKNVGITVTTTPAVSASPATLTATYSGVTVNVALANVGDGAEQWTVINDKVSNADCKWTFYYNDDLEEGATTSKLVDSVTLDGSLTAKSFIAFDFDLNVKMNSIQVTKDAGGKETYTPVSTAWAVESVDNATPAHVSGATWSSNELATLTWTKN